MTTKRKIDVAFGVVFAMMAGSAAFVDSMVAFGVPIAADSPYAMGRFIFHSYAEGCDPFYAANPFFNQMAALLAVFIFLPFYVYLSVGFFRNDSRIRVPGFIFAGALIYAMLLHIIYEFFGPDPALHVQNVPKYIAYNCMYLIIPVLLIFRLRKGF